MFDINKLVRENIKRLTPYSCARDDYKGTTGVFLDANENPFGSLNRYPDPYQQKLKAAICKIKGVQETSIFLGNGSDEIIDLCFRVFCNPGIDKAMIFPPTYGMYEVSASVNDVAIIKVPLNNEFQINIKEIEPYFKDEKLKLMFICSPNNPTGNCMNHSDIEYIIRNFDGIVVLDEAYSDFSNEASFIDKTDLYPNLIVMQTFSKALGLASVRIGIAFSDPAIIHYFNRIKPPYNISTINQEAALNKLTDIELIMKQVNVIKNERERLASELASLNITCKVFPSDANFLLIKVKDANNIYNYLVNNEIIVRNRSSLIDNCLRITVGTKDENDKLLDALKRINL
jgi:histidinol-phosphate aminotransferase